MMLVKNSRALGLLPQFSRLLRPKRNGVNKFCSTAIPAQPTTEGKNNLAQQQENKISLDNFRFRYTEFLPDPTLRLRNLIREKLERKDMLKRRNVLYIPQFYVGSVLAVTTTDQHALGKQARFVGICIQRIFNGLNSTFLLRNVIQNQGVEISYFLYSPLIQKIELLRLEKRLDDQLLYLRDSPNEYSTFPMDMTPEFFDESKPVPINTLKVPLNPRPWHQRWERKELKGAVLPELSEKIMRQAKERATPWEKYDLMDHYRKTTPEEDQKDILEEISEELKLIESKMRSEKRRKVYVRPPKQKVF